MKNINIKMLMILLGILTVFTFNGCSEGDGEGGAHSEINLLDGAQQDDGPVNQAPIADAGDDSNVSVAYSYEDIATTVDLNGTRSTDDGLNAPLTYSWSLVSSGSTTEPDLTDATSEIAKVEFRCSTFSEASGDTERCPMNDAGQWVCEYTYSLSINDGQYSDDDNVTIRVAYDDMCRY